jgi:cytochrome o ubiquinol oxidase operon protein cyoD
MGPSPEDTDRGPRSHLTDIGRSLRSHLTDTGRGLASHLGRIGRELPGQLGHIGRGLLSLLTHIGRGLLSLLTHIGRGLRSGLVGANRSLRSYLAGIDRDLRPYLTGFALALILTAIPFALVAFNPLPKAPTLIIIGVAAAIQVLVHLRYFLHLDLTSTPRENLVAIVFTAILIFLMVGGSFWIMFDLHSRMAM